MNILYNNDNKINKTIDYYSGLPTTYVHIRFVVVLHWYKQTADVLDIRWFFSCAATDNIISSKKKKTTE